MQTSPQNPPQTPPPSLPYLSPTQNKSVLRQGVCLLVTLTLLVACDSEPSPPAIPQGGVSGGGVTAGVGADDPVQACVDACQGMSTCEAFDECGSYTMSTLFRACEMGCRGARLDEVTALMSRACEPALLTDTLAAFDQPTDLCEGPDLCEGQLCGAGFVCDPESGDCVNPCEVIDCAEGFTCQEGTCVDLCEGVSCPGESVCSAGVCVNNCQGVSCEEGEACDPLTGMCSGPCDGVVCPQGQACSSNTGACVAFCAEELCAEGEVCDPNTGACVDLCDDVRCAEGYGCNPESGACVDLCDGVSCVEGWACEAGVCMFDNPCEEVSCAPEYVCNMSSGRCQSFFCAEDVFDREALNNNAERASALPAGTQRLDDLTLCLFDIDWYTLVLPANASMRVGAHLSGETRGLNLRLYEAPDVLTPVVELDNITAPSFMGVRAEPIARRFYVRVASANGQYNQNRYTLSVEFNLPGELCNVDRDCPVNVACEQALCGGEGGVNPDPSEPLPADPLPPVDPPAPVSCTDDAYEPNQSFMEAEELTLPSALSAQVCPDNTDIYALDLTALSRVSATLTYESGPERDLNLYLLNDQGTPLDTSAQQSGAEEVSAEAGPGRVYVSVFGASATVSNSYSLTVSAEAVEQMSACEDALDPNDSLGTPHPLSLPASYPELVICSDSDAYSVELNQGDRLDVQLGFAHADGDLDVVLYSEAFSSVAQSVSTNDDEELSYIAPSAGTYTLLVYLFNEAGPQTYSLNATLTPGADPAP